MSDVNYVVDVVGCKRAVLGRFFKSDCLANRDSDRICRPVVFFVAGVRNVGATFCV